MRGFPMSAVVLLAVALAGCTGSTEASDATSPSQSTSVSEDETSQPPTSDEPSLDDIPPLTTDFASASESVQSDSWGVIAGGDLQLMGITVDGNRVLISLTGSDAPAWVAQYTVSPTSQGKGDPVVVNGAFVLQVVVAGLSYPPEEWAPVIAGTTSDNDVVVDPPFEGQAVVFIGRSSLSAYRIGQVDGGLLVEFAE